MNKIDVGYLENEADVKAIAKEGFKELKYYSKTFKNIQIVKGKAKVISYKAIKRSFDIVASLFGIFCLFFIMVFVKLANLIHGDNESIIFKQVRIGKDGRNINIYKIRSMIPNAEQVLEELMKNDEKIKAEYEKNKKLKNDPRITKVGAFIRKTSLDEFAQFINVLKGDMTVVGPRPYLPREKEDMGAYYKDIISCKPGITGLWQVEGRSDIGFRDRCKLDRFYNQHKCALFDMKIFLKTFLSVLKSDGAR